MFTDFSEVDGRVTALYTVIFVAVGMVIFNYGTYFGANILELEAGNVGNMLLGLGLLLSALPAFVMKAVYEANLAVENE